MIWEHTPQSLIEDCLEQIADGEVYCGIDLKDGYFHAEVEKDSQKFTSFMTHKGQFEFTVVLFGILTAPSVFTRFLRHIFHNLINRKIMVLFQDDGLVKDQTYRECLDRLREVFEVALKYGLKIHWKKCQLLMRKIEFLGNIIMKGTITPSLDQIEAMVNYLEPRTEKQIRRFLGLAGILRKFIWNYAHIAKPLSDLLRNDVTFKFGHQQRAAFGALKMALVQALVLQLFREDRVTELHMDASQDGYGALCKNTPTTSVLNEPENNTNREKVLQLQVGGHGHG